MSSLSGPSPRQTSASVSMGDAELFTKYDLNGNLKDLERNEAELSRTLSGFVTSPFYEKSLVKLKEKTKDTKYEDLVSEFGKWIKIFAGVMEGRDNCLKSFDTEWRSYKMSKIKKAESFRNLLNKKKSKDMKLRKDLLKTIEYLAEKASDPLVKNYLDEIGKWLKVTKTVTEIPIFHELELGANWLATSHNFQRLATDDEAALRDNPYSKHAITFIYGLQIKKIKPDMQPGTDCIIEGLHNQILQKSFYPLRLAKITKGEKRYYYQISRQSYQSDIEFLFSKSIDVASISDPCTYSSLLITCLLSNLYFCNPSNIIVELAFDESETITAVNYKGIEGFAFKTAVRGKSKKSQAVSKNGNQSPQIQLSLSNQEENGRNILFLFPQMDFPIPTELIEKIMSISPELMIINWLNLLEYENRSCIKLQKKKIFTSIELEGDPKNRSDKGFGLPIKISPGLTSRVYESFKKIQIFLSKHQDVTLHHLFEMLNPSLADYYLNFRTNPIPGSILDQFRTIVPRDLNYLTSSGSDANSNSMALKPGPPSPRSHQIANALGELLVEIPFSGINKNIECQIFESLSYIPLRNLVEICWLMIPRNNLSFELLQFFKSIGMDINELNHDYGGYTLLHVAVIEDNIPLVDLLLKSGADINARDERSETPLDKATKRKYGAMIEFLLANGATPTIASYARK